MREYTHTILCVDDEENVLRALKRLLRKERYRILSASTGREGLRVLEEEDVHLVICDQRMPEMSGTEFLARVKEDYPDVIRMILTGYTDVDSITESVNKGHIYKFLLKPWNDQNLKQEIQRALEQYDLIAANRALHEKVLRQNQELTRINEGLETLVRERTRELQIQNQALELSHAILEDLPVPIVGVSAEGMVVLVNREARALETPEGAIEEGRRLSRYFDELVSGCVARVLRDGASESLKAGISGESPFRVTVTPLSGRFKGKGVILALESRGKGRGPCDP
ncbi:MAG: response regulator [Deltaproteobacteria bacterium]|nr:response regulator [Deltaproteobacteria bacterium]MBW1922315.1 response regulator [Deltaproteobacteria bacterium]MBW1948066.1 response regulator [Deltaproteobacteria bacterium]MBW2009036.1 response regulator [Deltaproteobacteria bacterium]MBW2346462.1 response regulator [Deltaproteobacteria bacterium]